MSRHCFVVIEGIDGVGKTTVAELLASMLNAELIKTPLPPFEAFRTFYDECGNPTARFLYYLSVVVLSSSKIHEILEKRDVICDRYIFSTIAYDYAMGVDANIIDINRLPIIIPDCSICFTVEETVRYQRLVGRKGHVKPYDEQDTLYLDNVKTLLKDLCSCVIDTTHYNPIEVVSLILSMLNPVRAPNV